MNAGSAPERVGQAHLADQSANREATAAARLVFETSTARTGESQRDASGERLSARRSLGHPECAVRRSFRLSVRRCWFAGIGLAFAAIGDGNRGIGEGARRSTRTYGR